MGLFISLVSSTLPNPTIVLVIPAVVPVKVLSPLIVSLPVKWTTELSSARKLSAVCVAVLMGLFASLVLSTLPNPTIVFVIPAVVPLNVLLPAIVSFPVK